MYACTLPKSMYALQFDRVVVPSGAELPLRFELKRVPERQVELLTFMVANERARQVECQSITFFSQHPNYQTIKMSGGGSGGG
jgi:hypothetical protein